MDALRAGCPGLRPSALESCPVTRTYLDRKPANLSPARRRLNAVWAKFRDAPPVSPIWQWKGQAEYSRSCRNGSPVPAVTPRQCCMQAFEAEIGVAGCEFIKMLRRLADCHS